MAIGITSRDHLSSMCSSFLNPYVDGANISLTQAKAIEAKVTEVYERIFLVSESGDLLFDNLSSISFLLDRELSKAIEDHNVISQGSIQDHLEEHMPLKVIGTITSALLKIAQIDHQLEGEIRAEPLNTKAELEWVLFIDIIVNAIKPTSLEVGQLTGLASTSAVENEAKIVHLLLTKGREKAAAFLVERVEELVSKYYGSS